MFTVPLIVIFTKFDAQVILESVNLNYLDAVDKWSKARENAEITFQKIYLPKVSGTEHPPVTYVQLEGKNDETTLHKVGNL